MNELPAGLTAEQVEVLRLVQQNLSSKEIARLLGISKSAIDQRLDRARQVLGASSRREAARIYAGLEPGYDRITRDPAALVYPAPATAFPSAADRNDMPVQRVQATRSAFDMDPGVGHVSLRQLLKGVRPHDLSTAQRFILTLLVAIGVPMLLGGLSMLLYGVVAIGRLFLR
ncbi:DNA-binding CsgD family transcriptional regulator [Sphingomonas leidyi]|uniref:DNA-binding CsgD family transcriptional regulator n=1 Tax=Sphingomonas leidyi TaxID=68569 RepID=A0A7X5UW25_9SPHN|nr:helix-turn-helix transcriptional regulator [Sphingomonas leidyi]NIJ63203.1 DNA-binding CsgD family transcriptional regulator [Sphingomonas leidyi]